MIMNKSYVEVCFSPALYPLYHSKEKITVVTDVFRATTAICTAFENGVDRIIPVASLNEAESYKCEGYLIAAERDGIKPPFADFGNSPYNFMRENIKDKTIVYSTTNGTQAIKKAADAKMVVIAAFINISAVADLLVKLNEDVIVLCAGWKDRFSLEDSVFCGALSEMIIKSGKFSSKCDSVNAAIDLWKEAEKDINDYKTKFAHTHRLKKLMLDDVIEYCLSLDKTSIIPVLDGDTIVKYEK